MTLKLQLFREGLSEKVHATNPKGIVGGFEFTITIRVLNKNKRDEFYFVLKSCSQGLAKRRKCFELTLNPQ